MAKKKYKIVGIATQMIGGKYRDMLKVKYAGDDSWVLKPLDYFKKK